MEAYDHLYRRHGFIYAPQRKPIDFPGRADFRHIFFLRDPRDVLVSGYYSFAFTHKPPPRPQARQAFKERRKRIQSLGIDRYAIEQCDSWIKPLLNEYRALRESATSHILINYDDYCSDPSWMIDRIAAFLNATIDPAERDRIAALASPVAAQVQSDQHKRSGRSGQFRTELTPETQALLNAKMADELAYWGFDAK